MRLLGVALTVGGIVLAGWGAIAAFESPRRRAVAGSLGAPLGVLLAAIGAVLLLVPGFLDP